MLKDAYDLMRIGVKDPRFAMDFVNDTLQPYTQAMGGGARLAGQALPLVGNVVAGFMDFGNRSAQGEDAIRAGSGAVATTLGGALGGGAAMSTAAKLASKAPGWLKLPAMGVAAIGGSLLGSAAAGGASNLVNDLRPDKGFTEERRYRDAKAREQQALAAGDQIGAMKAKAEADNLMKTASSAAGIKEPDPLGDSLEQYGRIGDFKRRQSQLDFRQDEANAREMIRFRTGNQALGEFLRSQDQARLGMLQGAMSFRY